jgi:hypothetical protein
VLRSKYEYRKDSALSSGFNVDDERHGAECVIYVRPASKAPWSGGRDEERRGAWLILSICFVISHVIIYTQEPHLDFTGAGRSRVRRVLESNVALANKYEDVLLLLLILSWRADLGGNLNILAVWR